MARELRIDKLTQNHSLSGHQVMRVVVDKDGDFRIPPGIAPGTLLFDQRNQYVTTVPVIATEEEREQPVAIQHI